MRRAAHVADREVAHAALEHREGFAQPLLAWQLHRHADPARPAAYRLAVKLGLVATFVLGAGAGMLLGRMQAPDAAAGPTLPWVGWSLAGGGPRPAHFIGIHAQQLLPLVGLAIAARHGRSAKGRVWAAAVAYTLVFAALFAVGLGGR